MSWLVLGMSDSVLGSTDGTGAAETEMAPFLCAPWGLDVVESTCNIVIGGNWSYCG